MGCLLMTITITPDHAIIVLLAAYILVSQFFTYMKEDACKFYRQEIDASHKRESFWRDICLHKQAIISLNAENDNIAAQNEGKVQ
jgi:hypothetical protein